MTDSKPRKRWLIQGLKVGLSAALIGYLIWDSLRRGEGVFADEHGFNPQKFWAIVHHAETYWYFLLLAFLTAFGGVFITFFRWWLLLRALTVPLGFMESLRFSFIGFLLNLAPMGMVGGDLAKVILAARRFPGRRLETLASVFVDRVLGLYGLFLVASGAILTTEALDTGPSVLQGIGRLTLGITAGFTAFLIFCWAPDLTGGRLLTWLERIPFAGRVLARFVAAFRSYRHYPGILLFSLVMTVPVHLCFAVSIYFIGLGLFDRVHDLAAHFVFCPLAAVMQILPVSIGPAEFVLDRLFAAVPLADGTRIPAGHGLVTLLVYRLLSLILASGGMLYVLAAGEEWRTAMAETEKANEWAELEATPRTG